jgi:hypothetical protein
MNVNKSIKKSQLLEIIKAVVRETLKERKDKWIQGAVDPSHKGYCTPMTKSTCTPKRKALAKRFKSGDIHQDNVDEQQMQEVAPPGWGPDKKHAKLYNKIKAQYPDNDAAAYATMWKIHNKISEALQEAGLTSEASYKVVSPTSAQVQKDDQARRVQTEPDVNEASYKVVAPTQAQVQKDDQARRVQTEPKVSENHKVQHRSACTVNDLPNDPKNVRDPEVPNC